MKIKFRAWLKQYHTMMDVISIEMDVMGDGTDDAQIAGYRHDNGEWDCMIPMDEVELMQYTGLKDKNGKEVYEGDIILENESCCTYQIKWLGKYCAFIAEDMSGGDGKYLDDLLYFEVIGNVWENE